MAHWTSGNISSKYAAYRPTYPKEVFERVAEFASGRKLAIDIGCGTGQAVKGLASTFDKIVGVDPSPTQVAEAWKPLMVDQQQKTKNAHHCDVSYIVGGAETFVVDPIAKSNAEVLAKVDLVTVAQALHWFDIPKFTGQITPLLKPDGQGVFATWNYNTCDVLPKPCGDAVHKLDAMLMREGYWPKERKHIDDNYKNLIPQIEQSSRLRLVHQEAIFHDVPMSVKDAVLYFSTWSGIQRYHAAHPENISLLEDLEQIFYAQAPDPTDKLLMRFPINLFIFTEKNLPAKL